MARTIVATFDSETEARRVAGALANQGVDAREIQVIDSATARQREEEWREPAKGGGFWSWLFGDVEAETGGFPDEERTLYADALRRDGALLMVTTADDRASRVASLIEARGGDVKEGRGRGGRAPAAASATATPREQILPVTEEKVKIGKRTVGRGTVRIYRHVTERPIEEHLQLREQRIKVERRPADRPVTGSPDQAFKEETIELTETAEEPVVEKHARVVEEVVIGQDVREREHTVRETSRRTDVQVDRGSRDFSSMESEFRQHCTKHFGTGIAYEDCAPAYRYGYELAGRGQADWMAAEADARRQWEAQHAGTWDRFKDAIRYGWDRARGVARAA